MDNFRIWKWLARDVGDYVGTVQVLLEAGAILPEHAVDLEPSDAVLEMLP